MYSLMQEKSLPSYDCCILYRLNAAIGKVILIIHYEQKKIVRYSDRRIGGPLQLVCFRSSAIIVIN